MPNRTFWIEAKESLEQNSKTTLTSSRILGIGIIFVALLLLSIGLIVGLKFPDFVQERITEDQCIVSDKSTNLRDWAYDEELVRYERLYYWSITNHNSVLNTGENITYKCLGPYVYKKVATKTNVCFMNGLVSFKYLITYDFDERSTVSECGESCNEYDQITLLDKETIKDLVDMENDDYFLLRQIPDWINAKIDRLSALQTNITDNIFSLLGSLNDIPDAKSLQDEVGELVMNVSFGRWIGQNDTNTKILLTISRNGSSFSALEMESLYNNLSTDTITSLVHGSRLHGECMTFISTNICFKDSEDFHTSSGLPFYPNDLGLNYSNFRNICGLIILLKYLNQTNGDCFLNSSDWVKDLFCSQNDTYCQERMSGLSYATNFLYSLSYFVIYHLLPSVKQSVMAKSKTNFFKTLTVSQLSIGYTSNTGFVDGYLTENLNRKPKAVFSFDVKYGTCLLERNTSNNFISYNFNDFDSSPLLQDNVFYTYFIPPLKDFKTCRSHNPALTSFYLLVEELSCVILFRQPSLSSFSDIVVYRYTPDSTNCKKGLLYPCCNQRNTYNFHINLFTSSFVDIEPLSGKIWRKNIVEENKYEVSSYQNILKEVLDFRVLEKSIPVSKRQSSVVISNRKYRDFKSRIQQMMDASCAAMISLTCIATIVFVFAMTILCWPKAKTKVHPFILEPSQTGANLRSL